MIRPEIQGDAEAVRGVLTAAFPSPAEATLVDELRAAGDLVLGLVAEEDAVLGYIAFSRLKAPGDIRAVALAPVGVLPKRQRRGIGARLVQEGLLRLSDAGEDLVVVLGEPEFYGRFGFGRRAAARLSTPYDGPYLLAKALTEQGCRAAGEMRYAPPFAALG